MHALRTHRGTSRRLPAGASTRDPAGRGYCLCAIVCCLFILPACESKPVGESTRLTIDDVEAMTHEMSQSLLTSGVFSKRNAASEPWTVTIDKVLNLSDEVMTENEQWSIMAQVRGSASLTTLYDTWNVRFAIPPERAASLKGDLGALELRGSFWEGRKVTHTMTATFRSITRAQSKQRSDLYYCEFDLQDLSTGETLWSDRFEFKRQARGHVWD